MNSDWRDECVEIDERDDLVRYRVCDSGDDHPAVGMSDRHYVRQVLLIHDAKNVPDVGAKIDLAIEQMPTFTDTR